MKIDIKDLSEIKKQIHVSVPVETVAAELERVYAKIGKGAKIKGFRQGKIPRSILEQYYKQDAESETVRNLVSDHYPEVIRQSGVSPVASPEITITVFSAEEGLTFHADVEIRPAFEITGYKDLSLVKDSTEPLNEDIEENLKSLQERMAQLVPVTDERPATTSDLLAIDFRGLVEGKPVAKYEGKDSHVQLGENRLLPELEAVLVGMKKGETKQVDVNYPSEWSDKEWAGKAMIMEVTLKEIKEKKVPELNDEFAKDLGNFTSLEEVKTKIGEDVQKAKEQSARNNLRRQVIEKLIEKNNFLVPEAMIQHELEDMFRRFEGNLKNQGMTLEQAGITKDGFYEKNKEAAIFRVRGGLLFDAIAEKEQIAVSEEEMDQKIEEMAKLVNQPADTWKKYYRGMIREEKTLDYVLSQSKIKTKD